MICPKCGVDNADGPAFCRSCGEGLSHKGFADARVFPGIAPEAMKKSAIKAAQMTQKYGMTRHNVAAWGKHQFKNDVMRVAIGRKAVSMGGIGAKVTVAPDGGGSRVGLVWDKDNPQCRQVTGFFWQNLDRVTAPGGLKLAPRSMFLNAATVLLVIIALLSLFSAIGYYSEWQDSGGFSYYSYPSQGSVDAQAKLLTGAVGSMLFCLFASVAVVALVRRKSWLLASGLSRAMAFWYGIGCVGLLLGGLASFLAYGIVALALAIAAAVCISKSKGEFET